MKKLIFLIPIIFLLTGCYNYRELNDLAIISGVSISKNNNTYNITVEVINPKKEQDTSSGKEPDYVIYEGYGKSMQEAFRNIVKESPQKLYGAQIDILIIDEETAKEGLDEILDFFARDPEVRSEFYVVISKNDEALKIISPLVNLSSKNIVNSLKSTNKYMGISNLVTYHELLSNFINPYIEIALPSIEMIGNEKIGESNKNIESTTSQANNFISNMTIFKDNKMLDYLTKEESIGYNIIKGNTKTVLIRNEYDNNEFIINEIIESSTEIKPNIEKKEIIINIKGTASISEVNKKINLESDKEIKNIEKDLNKEVEELINKTIKNINNKYNSDIYGFREIFYKENPKEYKKLVKEYKDDLLNNISYKINSNIELIEKGNLNGGIYDK